MSSVAFSAQSTAWLESFLSDKSFQVNIKSKFSNVASFKFGVPKGSIFGTSLFFLYVIDMFLALNCDLLFLYVDDSCLLYQCMDVKEIKQKLKKYFSNVYD